MRSIRLVGLVFEKSCNFQVGKVGVGGVAENLNVGWETLTVFAKNEILGRYEKMM